MRRWVWMLPLGALLEFLSISLLKQDYDDRNDWITPLWSLCLPWPGSSYTGNLTGWDAGEIGALLKGHLKGTAGSVLKTLPDWHCRPDWKKWSPGPQQLKGTSPLTVTFTWNNAKLAHILCKIWRGVRWYSGSLSPGLQHWGTVGPLLPPTPHWWGCEPLSHGHPQKRGRGGITESSHV